MPYVYTQASALVICGPCISSTLSAAGMHPNFGLVTLGVSLYPPLAESYLLTTSGQTAVPDNPDTDPHCSCFV